MHHIQYWPEKQRGGKNQQTSFYLLGYPTSSSYKSKSSMLSPELSKKVSPLNNQNVFNNEPVLITNLDDPVSLDHTSRSSKFWPYLRRNRKDLEEQNVI